MKHGYKEPMARKSTDDKLSEGARSERAALDLWDGSQARR